MPESIQDRVLKVIANTRRVPVESVTPDSTFEELGIDSLDRINVLFELEGEFDIEIDDEQAKQVTTMRQMIEGIEQLVAAKEAGLEPPKFAPGAPAAETGTDEPEPPTSES